jgi:hypothetical protein
MNTKKINDEVVLILKNNTTDRSFSLGYVNIDKVFEKELLNIETLCGDKKVTLPSLLLYLQNVPHLSKLDGVYGYCKNLDDTYVDFTANYKDLIDDLVLVISSPEKYVKEKPQYNNHFTTLSEIKKIEIWEKINFSMKAYSIERAYDKCKQEKNIMLYSHRTSGWSNPLYQLTHDFSVTVDTNFGYGNSSYFYTILKYKNIEIIPFSDWINYKYAEFSELIRYSRNHELKNYSWYKVINYVKDACELSINDEKKFVEKYIIDECDRMVEGLENILIKDTFEFNQGFSEKTKPKHKVNISGFPLIEFRAEKMSGALDFIEAIMGFNEITNIKIYVDRIEKVNKRILTVLDKQLPILKNTLLNFYLKRDDKERWHKIAIDKNNKHDDRMNKFYKEIILSGQHISFVVDLHIDLGSIRLMVNDIFKKYYADCEDDYEKNEKIICEFKSLSLQIKEHKSIHEKIERYKEKINKYFSDT